MHRREGYRRLSTSSTVLRYLNSGSARELFYERRIHDDIQTSSVFKNIGTRPRRNRDHYREGAWDMWTFGIRSRAYRTESRSWQKAGSLLVPIGPSRIRKHQSDFEGGSTEQRGASVGYRSGKFDPSRCRICRGILTGQSEPEFLRLSPAPAVSVIAVRRTFRVGNPSRMNCLISLSTNQNDQAAWGICTAAASCRRFLVPTGSSAIIGTTAYRLASSSRTLAI